MPRKLLLVEVLIDERGIKHVVTNHDLDLPRDTVVHDVGVPCVEQIPHRDGNWQSVVQERPIHFLLHYELLF